MAGKTYLRCGKLFRGDEDSVLTDHTVVLEDGVITQVAPSSSVPGAAGTTELDHSAHFVMPSLIDVHTHLAYGNAKTEEDIDLYASMEFRTLRAMYFAHQVLAAGVTSIVVPGTSGMLASAVRDAVDAGLFEGPRTTAAGRYISSHQSLTDWYPTWVGVPSTSIGVLVRSRDEAIEEIRKQIKEGVDAVKIALDGIMKLPNGEYPASFTLDETRSMVDEIHRLGKIAITHSRGREATLYSAKAGVDLIFHASFMDEEALEAVVQNKCAISPTLLLLKNSIDFLDPTGKPYLESRHRRMKAEFDTAVKALRRAKAAGVPMPMGTDSGFAVTPYGEWHARELETYVEHLGFTPIEALRAATSVSARVVRPSDKVGTIAPGYRADFIALDADPTKNVSVLLDPSKMAAVLKDGRRVTPPRRGYDPRQVTDFSMTMFDDLYTRERVAELRRQRG